MVKKHVPVLDSNNDEAAPALAPIASESAESRKDNDIKIEREVDRKSESAGSTTKDLTRRYNQFSGEGDVDTFLNQFKEDEHAKSGDRVIAIVESQLNGTALKFFRCERVDGREDWESLKSSLRKRHAKQGATKQFQFAKLMLEGPGEKGIEDFFYEVRLVAAETAHDFTDVKLVFRELVPLALADCLDRCDSWLKLKSIVQENSFVIDRYWRGNKLRRTVASKEIQTKRQNFNKKMECFNCGGEHYKSACNKASNIKCFICGALTRKQSVVEEGRRKMRRN